MDKKSIVVYFRASEIPVKDEQGEPNDDTVKKTIPSAHIAGLLPFDVWQSSSLVMIAWAVKWPPVASKGLQPIRPMLVTSQDLEIPANSAVEVVKAA